MDRLYKSCFHIVAECRDNNVSSSIFIVVLLVILIRRTGLGTAAVALFAIYPLFSKNVLLVPTLKCHVLEMLRNTKEVE